MARQAQSFHFVCGCSGAPPAELYRRIAASSGWRGIFERGNEWASGATYGIGNGRFEHPKCHCRDVGPYLQRRC